MRIHLLHLLASVLEKRKQSWQSSDWVLIVGLSYHVICLQCILVHWGYWCCGETGTSALVCWFSFCAHDMYRASINSGGCDKGSQGGRFWGSSSFRGRTIEGRTQPLQCMFTWELMPPKKNNISHIKGNCLARGQHCGCLSTTWCLSVHVPVKYLYEFKLLQLKVLSFYNRS